MADENVSVSYNPKLRGRLKDAGNAYVILRGRQRHSMIKSSEQAQMEENQFFESNEDLIQEAIAYYYKGDKWQLGSIDTSNAYVFLDAYIKRKGLGIKLTDGKMPDSQTDTVPKKPGLHDMVAGEMQQNASNTMQKKSKSGQKTTVDEENMESLNGGKLTEEQKKGLNSVSAWMFRNVDKTGLTGDSAASFVNDFILNKPARLKLLAYYLVEKKKRKNPDVLDVMESQINYVPNLKELKNQMIATKWKFWKRLDGSHIYWNKLGDGMRAALSGQDLIASFASLSELESMDASGGAASQTAAQGDTTQPDSQEQQLDNAAKTRKAAYAKCLMESAKLRTELSKEGSEKNQAKIDELKRSVESSYNQMRNADKAIVSLEDLESEDKLKQKDAGKGNEVSGEETKTNQAAGYIGLGGSVGTGVAAGFKHFEKVEKIGWNIAESDKVIFNKMSFVLSSTAGVVGLTSALVQIADWVKHSDRTSASEHIANVFRIVETLAGASNNTYRAVKSGMSWAENAGKFSLNAISNANRAAFGTVGAITGTIQTGAAVGKMVTSMHREGKVSESKSQLNSLKKTGNMDADDADMAGDIIALQQRVARAQATSAAYQAAGGALQTIGATLDAFGITSIVGVIFNMAGTLVSLAGSIHQYFLKKSNKEKTIDAYLNLDACIAGIEQRIHEAEKEKMKKKLILQRVRETARGDMAGMVKPPDLADEMAGIAQQINGKSKEEENEEITMRQLAYLRGEKLRAEVRIKAAGMAGYPSLDAFYNKITGDYARFLYDKIFFENGEMIVEKSKKPVDKPSVAGTVVKTREQIETEPRMLYMNMLKNSGLKARFPQEGEKRKPKPSAENISRKLRI